jgi:translation initiation factor 5B
MGPKKKGAAKKGADGADDDFDAILAEVGITLPPAAPVLAPTAVVPSVDDKKKESKTGGDDGDDDDDDEEDDGEGAAGGAKDKKKKKKKKKDKKDEQKPVALSAAGKAILAQRQKQAEEEERVRKLQEELDRKAREEEEAEAARLKAIEDEKERKKKQKQDKIEAQKAAGTYMTKAEKEKAKKAQAKLESLKAAGILPEDPDTVESTSTKPVYGKKKKPVTSTSQSNEVEATKEEDTPVEVKQPTVEDWETDDWEVAVDNIDLLVSKVENLASQIVDEDEDRLDAEKKKESEKLKTLGLERAKREEELRVKRELEEREREEMERKEREAIIKKEQSRIRRTKKDEAARAARTPTNLRSPISCIMGHVDTGKTKLLDKIRHTNVQEGEAGGITQQIGATQFSRDTLSVQTQCMQRSQPFEIKIPGLLMIDTPGHESFSNLRSRGSSLCDIAILVIDLMHGLEQQTIESINLLKRKRTPFIVALNKVDRCYGWKTMPDSPIREALEAQDENCRLEFKSRAENAILQLNEQGLNAKLYWDNDDLSHTVSLVPTSAVSGEGVPDLLKMIITLTQERMIEQLMYTEILQCTVLEVKAIEGLGTTVDVVLVNGTLREGDTIVVSTMDGPVVTNIRALLTPPPNREMRIKSEYVHHQELKGAIGIKIVATDIARAIAGTPILVVNPEDDLDDVKDDVQSDLTKVMKSLETDSKGVMLHASTLGALEALLQFLREECKPPIPVSHINIGPIFKKDVMRAAIMNEKGCPEFATILAFDVRIDAEAGAMAAAEHVRIFSAEIIYHLFDQFSAYMNGLNEARKAEAMTIVNFPCVLKILPQHIFNKKDPIVIGVEVLEGTLRLGTILSIPQLNLDVGRVTSIENNHREAQVAKKGLSVAIKITNDGNPTLMYGRQFDDKSALYSKLTRASIDALKQFFKDEMTKDDWNLVIKLKKLYNIQ